MTSKTKKKPRIQIRSANANDIDGMLSVEFERYEKLYEEQPEKKSVIRSIFEKRFEIASGWMWVAIVNDRFAGFISGQPTNMRPEDFTSWEEVTDNGTLQRTYNEDGRNVYVVNLDVSRFATKLDVQYMLMAALGAKLIKTGKDMAIFESRMPGFRQWVFEENAELGEKKWHKLSNATQLELATEYAAMRIERNGKLVRKDRLLRFYDEAGFSFIKVLPNAFQDGESLNFGMLCSAKNPLSKKYRWPPMNAIVGFALAKVGKNEKLLSKFVG